MKIFKKSAIIAGALSLAAMAAVARQEKVLQIFSNGEIIKEYPVSEIDYIEVNDLIAAPSGMKADVSDNSITITWNAVAGATYNVYRSPDNVNFSLLASGLTETTYTDEAPLGGTNFYKVKAVVDGVESGYSSTATGTLTEDGQQSGIYLGITGFNQALYTYPVMRLTESSVGGFRDFVDNLTMKYGTLLYYSVDQAINALQSTTLPPDISTAAIVTFTDGLDQGSMMMDVPYNDDTEYITALKGRITDEKIAGLPITAYSIGIRGQDVKDVAMFTANLNQLASAPESEHAHEVSSMSEVNAKFKEIAEQLSKSSYLQTINLKMPGVSNGTKVRFTFDNVRDASDSQLYIEGTFNLKARALENVTYQGMTSTSGTTLKGTVEGIFVSFSIEGVRTADNKLIDSKFTDEWTYITSNGSWQINSEFDKTQNSEVITERSSAVIMLILDCSSSLGDDFKVAQANAKNFIDTLYGTSGGSDNPGGDTPDTAIYSTTPIDLSLSIWKDGKRYYLTKEEYAKANLSDAVVEGLTVVSGSDSFVLSPRDVQSGTMGNVSLTSLMYCDMTPTELQGRTISAKWTDINIALRNFGFTTLEANYAYYTDATRYNNGRFYNCIVGSGGSLYYHDYYYHIRGAVSTSHPSAIYWNDPDEMKLSVIIDGKREFLTRSEYDAKKDRITKIEGVAVIDGGVKFAVQLKDAQQGSIDNLTTARTLYGDIMPTELQGMIISAKMNEINNAIRSFGGTAIDTGYAYVTTATTVSSGGRYHNCVKGTGGNLNYHDYSLYVRGVVNLKD